MYTVETQYHKYAVIIFDFDKYNRIKISIHLSKRHIGYMQKSIFVCVLGVLFLVVSNHGQQLVINDDDNDDDSKDESGLTAKSREVVANDNSILESVGEPLVRRQFFDLNKLLQRRQTSGFTTGQRQYQQYALEAHNEHRARHCVSPLELDDIISRSAQNYAQHLAKINQMVHSGTSGLGENLYMQWSSVVIKTIKGE
jgi:CRISPR/Cas system-associated endoribonuclease Cas2